MRFNLAPRRPFKYARALAVLAGVVAGVAVLGAGAWESARLARARAHAEAAQQTLARARSELAVAESVAAPRRRALAARDAVARGAVDPGLVRRLEPLMPPDAWLSSLSLSNGRLALEGSALSWDSVAALARALARQPWAASVALSHVAARGSGAGYDFQMRVDLAERARPGPGGRAR